MNALLIAIDPGASGGIAHQPVGGRPCACSMPDTEGDLLDYLRSLVAGESETPVVFVEQVGGFIKGNPAPGSAMFNFGRNYGFLLGVLQALNFRIELIRPQAWQKVFGVGTASACSTKGEWKNKLKAKAQQLYPQIKVTQKTADALLILEYGKMRQLVTQAPNRYLPSEETHAEFAKQVEEVSNEEKEAIIDGLVKTFKTACVSGRLIEGEEFKQHLRTMPPEDFDSLNQDWAVLYAGE